MNLSDKKLLQEHVKSLVDKSKKHLNKKHPNYSTLMEQIIIMKDILDKFEKSEKEKLDIVKFNKKYKFWDFLFDLLSSPENNQKLGEIILDVLSKFFTLNIPDLNLVIESIQEKEFIEVSSDKIVIMWKKRIIDQLVDSITKQFNTNDEDVWLEIIKLTKIIFFTKFYSIHQESILKIYRVISRIIISSKKPNVIDQGKLNLKEITESIYQNLENKELSSFLKKFNFKLEKINQISNVSDHNQGLYSNKYFGILDTPLNLLIKRMYTQAVDDICIYYSKLEEDMMFDNHKEIMININNKFPQEKTQETYHNQISNITEENDDSMLASVSEKIKSTKIINNNFSVENMESHKNIDIDFEFEKIQKNEEINIPKPNSNTISNFKSTKESSTIIKEAYNDKNYQAKNRIKSIQVINVEIDKDKKIKKELSDSEPDEENTIIKSKIKITGLTDLTNTKTETCYEELEKNNLNDDENKEYIMYLYFGNLFSLCNII